MTKERIFMSAPRFAGIWDMNLKAKACASPATLKWVGSNGHDAPLLALRAASSPCPWRSSFFHARNAEQAFAGPALLIENAVRANPLRGSCDPALVSGVRDQADDGLCAA